MQGAFFDQFFFWVLISATALTAIDWWIGPEGRARMRDRVGEWWLHVTETSFLGLIAEDAQRVRSWLLRLFGRWFSLRAVLLCAVISVTVSILIVLGNQIVALLSVDATFQREMLVFLKAWLGIELRPADLEAIGIQRPELDRLLQDLDATTARIKELALDGLKDYILPLVLANALLDWVSLGLTLKFLDWMSRSLSATRLFLIILADILVAICLAALVVLAVVSYSDGSLPFEMISGLMEHADDIEREIRL